MSTSRIEKRIVVRTGSSEETERLGERIGRELERGAVLCLTGALGTGKTTLTKGIARGLGVSDLVHSPTFTLIHEHRGRLPVYHFDLYRLDTVEQIEDLDYESYFHGLGVTVIEWAEKMAGLLPEDRLEIHINEENSEHTFELQATGPESAGALERLKAG